MAYQLDRQADAGSAVRRGRRRPGERDEDGIIPILAKTVRQVEASAQRGRVRERERTAFQVVALLMREERARIKDDPDVSDSERANVLTRLDGIASILAKTAARDTSLLALLAEGAQVSYAAADLKGQMERAAGRDPDPSAAPVTTTTSDAPRRVIPPTVMARQLANPFLPPDFAIAGRPRPKTHRLVGWELLTPLFRAFEYGGDSTCMQLPDADELPTTFANRSLMRHQAQVVAAAAQGHRTFLLADEPGLGKTAQALLAADAAAAFPLLVVVPNVVKANWAREAQLWTPNRTSTVIHGDGEDTDGFADIVIVNYDILDRHADWLSSHGFKGMVVDEAHFIKNKSSQRSRHALDIAARIRSRRPRALFMALTGTPLINDTEDMRALWEFLGWIEGDKPTPSLMAALEETGLTPPERGFYAAARAAVIDCGIVRRRKVDVAADIPARRIADVPVELDDAVSTSIRASEDELARRLLARYDAMQFAKAESGVRIDPNVVDVAMVDRVAVLERKNAGTDKSGDNVFMVMRKIGQAKAALAADFSAQLARNVGKVVFFAKHIDVMDVAEETFARRGLAHVSIRGEQSAQARKDAIEAFHNDPGVAVAVCSLTAAGVGLNLHVASNVVLAELSWTSAEQTQAIDRVHRIGQENPVTAWRIIAAQTIDPKLAEIIDAKAGLAARALDGSDEEVGSSADIQVQAMAALLTDALERRLTGAVAS